MIPTFPDEVKRNVIAIQNNYCAVSGCHEKICDIHHRLSNSKYNRKTYPLLIQSIFIAIGFCRGHHEDEKILKEVRIHTTQAEVYEEYLRNLK